MDDSKKLWGGRFSCDINPVMDSFNSSIQTDQNMWMEDIKGSQAYVKALEKVGIVSRHEKDFILDGLAQVYKEWSTNTFVLKKGDEDIHTANERRLEELIGSVAGKLHSGRSRNDQVVTDTRLWLRHQIHQLRSLIGRVIQTIIGTANGNIDILMPGYTHMQRAQPIRFSHWILGFAWMFQRDSQRLDEILQRVDVLPLGSGAIAGNPFNIDRDFLAQELSFSAVTENSMDAVSDRDFIVEFLFWASLLCLHLSKLAEDILIYSTREFSFLSVSESFSTGSSLMPQKRNADSLELIRGKCGRICGQCSGFMMTLKGLPSTYNKDLQEDKEYLVDTCSTVNQVLHIIQGVVSTLQVPFREAHHISGQCVAVAEHSNTTLDNLTLNDYRNVSSRFEEDVQLIWDYESSVEQYTARGGTSRQCVLQQIDKLNLWLQESGVDL